MESSVEESASRETPEDILYGIKDLFLPEEQSSQTSHLEESSPTQDLPEVAGAEIVLPDSNDLPTEVGENSSSSPVDTGTTVQATEEEEYSSNATNFTWVQCEDCFKWCKISNTEAAELGINPLFLLDQYRSRLFFLW